jgi:hypothetical protein
MPDIMQAADSVTIDPLICLDARSHRTMICKPKKLNGSPGRARTADLVINSSRSTLFMDQKV